MLSKLNKTVRKVSVGLRADFSIHIIYSYRWLTSTIQETGESSVKYILGYRICPQFVSLAHSVIRTVEEFRIDVTCIGLLILKIGASFGKICVLYSSLVDRSAIIRMFCRVKGIISTMLHSLNNVGSTRYRQRPYNKLPEPRSHQQIIHGRTTAL